ADPRDDDTPRSAADDRAARRVERLHDDRLVRASEGSRVAPLVDRRPLQLEHRVLRVPAAGAGEPHRLRPLHAAAAEDPAGSGHADRIRALRRAVHGAAAEARLSLGVAVPGRRCLFRLPFMSSAAASPSPFEKYRHIVVEGPIGAGKTSLARRLSERFGAKLVLEDPSANPFLERFYRDARRYALPTQLFFLFQRVNQLRDLAQQELFSQSAVGDFLL